VGFSAICFCSDKVCIFCFCFNVFQDVSPSLELTKVDEVDNAREGCGVALSLAIYDCNFSKNGSLDSLMLTGSEYPISLSPPFSYSSCLASPEFASPFVL